MKTELTPVVTIKNETLVTDSRNVAEYFKKDHSNVLKDVDRLIEMGVVDFHLTLYTHPQNGQSYRYFEMTRDGFTLLAMGFTGKKALQFKLKYIAQFNAMEEQLKRPPLAAALSLQLA